MILTIRPFRIVSKRKHIDQQLQSTSCWQKGFSRTLYLDVSWDTQLSTHFLFLIIDLVKAELSAVSFFITSMWELGSTHSLRAMLLASPPWIGSSMKHMRVRPAWSANVPSLCIRCPTMNENNKRGSAHQARLRQWLLSVQTAAWMRAGEKWGVSSEPQ